MKLRAESQNIQGMNILLAERLVSKNYEARSGKSKYQGMNILLAESR
jgi:hypothetical protein